MKIEKEGVIGGFQGGFNYLYDKSTAYAYNFIIGKQESFNNLNITTIKYKNEKLDMIFNLTIDSNGKITSLKKKYK